MAVDRKNHTNNDLAGTDLDNEITGADLFPLESSIIVSGAAAEYLSEKLSEDTFSEDTFSRTKCQEIASHLASNLAAIARTVDSLIKQRIPF